ncbi:MAG: DUF4132 domain-containing protein, partial [Myxococcota bacterium]
MGESWLDAITSEKKKLPKFLQEMTFPHLVRVDRGDVLPDEAHVGLVHTLSASTQAPSVCVDQLRAATTEASRNTWIRTIFDRWERETSFNGRYDWIFGALADISSAEFYGAWLLPRIERWSTESGTSRKRALKALRVFTRDGSDEAMRQLLLVYKSAAHDSVRDAALELFELGAEDRGEDHRALLNRLLPIDEELLALKKPKGIPNFIDKEALGPLTRRGAPVREELRLGFVRALTTLDTFASSLFIERVRSAFDARSMADMIETILKGWEEKDFHGRYKWVRYAAAHFGDDRAALMLEQPMYAWQKGNDTDRKRAIQTMPFFGTLDTPTSVMILLGLTHVQDRPSVFDAAIYQLRRVAKRKRMSVEQLGDEVIPDCGLDHRGMRDFDLGGRTVTLVLDQEFSPSVELEDGSRLHHLPAPEPRDDPNKVELARTQWGVIEAKLCDVVKIQSRRMEHAMVSRRRWDVEEWRAVILGHPLMINFARRMVWGVYERDDLVQTFRADEAGGLVDQRSDEVWLANPDDEIGLVHPLEMDTADRQAWARSFAEDEIFAPIAQLGRAIYTPTDDELREAISTQFAGQMFDASALKRVMKQRMWRRETGFSTRLYFYKSYADGTPDVYIFISPGLEPGGHSDVEQEIVRIEFGRKISSA